MKEPVLTDAQRAFMALIRTPYADGGVKMMRIVQAIESADEKDRVDLVTCFLQAFVIDRRDEPPVVDPMCFTREQLHDAIRAYDLCIANGTIEFDKLLSEGRPVRDVATNILRQLELLEPFGLLVKMWLMDQIAAHPGTPYLEQQHIPKPSSRPGQELLNILERRPFLFVRVYRTVQRYYDKPVRLGECIRQLIAGEPEHVVDVVIGWAYSMRSQFQELARQRVFTPRPRSTGTLTPSTAEVAARSMDTTDKKKVN